MFAQYHITIPDNVNKCHILGYSVFIDYALWPAAAEKWKLQNFITMLYGR
jgi:hypothetical protein